MPSSGYAAHLEFGHTKFDFEKLAYIQSLTYVYPHTVAYERFIDPSAAVMWQVTAALFPDSVSYGPHNGLFTWSLFDIPAKKNTENCSLGFIKCCLVLRRTARMHFHSTPAHAFITKYDWLKTLAIEYNNMKRSYLLCRKVYMYVFICM